MKKVSCILGLLILLNGVVFANDIDNPKPATGLAVMKTGSVFKVYFKGEKVGSVTVRISKIDGDVVFSETFRGVDNFVRPYNFSKLPEGDYVIELVTDTEKKIEKVGYYNGKVETTKNPLVEKQCRLTPVIGENDKYVLSVPNKQKDVLTIKIFDASNKLVYKQVEKVSADFARVYNLSKISKNFVIEVTDQHGISTSIKP